MHRLVVMSHRLTLPSRNVDYGRYAPWKMPVHSETVRDPALRSTVGCASAHDHLTDHRLAPSALARRTSAIYKPVAVCRDLAIRHAPLPRDVIRLSGNNYAARQLSIRSAAGTGTRAAAHQLLLGIAAVSDVVDQLVFRATDEFLEPRSHWRFVPAVHRLTVLLPRPVSLRARLAKQASTTRVGSCGRRCRGGRRGRMRRRRWRGGSRWCCSRDGGSVRR